MTDLKNMFGDRLKHEVPLAPYTTFKIGGPAEFFLEVRSADELAQAVLAARSEKMPVYILAGGTNILVGDKGIRGLVIRNASGKISIKGMRGVVGKDHEARIVFVEAESGVPMNQLVRTSCDEGLSGLEMQLGLPGSVGGAVFMNSKWMHPPGFVGDAIHQATILTPTGSVEAVSREYFDFSYGKSKIQTSGDIILAVTFGLLRKTKEEVWQIANDSIAYRRETQPQGVKTAGCAFKNISPAEAVIAATPNGTTSAGFLIDHAGCKNMQVNDAAVSQVHANFIVNTGQAKASDVVELMDRIRQRVRTAFSVELKEEVLKVGDFS